MSSSEQGCVLDNFVPLTPGSHLVLTVSFLSVVGSWKGKDHSFQSHDQSNMTVAMELSGNLHRQPHCSPFLGPFLILCSHYCI